MVEPAAESTSAEAFWDLVTWDRRRFHIAERWWIVSALLVTLMLAGLALYGMVVPVGDWNLFGPDADGVGWMLAVTPVRGLVPDTSQSSLGYVVLRFGLYALVAAARFILPALAAGSFAADRLTGRLMLLQLTRYPPRALFLSRVVATSSGFLLPACFILVFETPLLVADRVPPFEIARVMIETALAVLLTATISIACSTLFRSPWSARVGAYTALFVCLPPIWWFIIWAPTWLPHPDALLFCVNPIGGNGIEYWEPTPRFGYVVGAQAVCAITIGALACLLGVKRLKDTARGW